MMKATQQLLFSIHPGHRVSVSSVINLILFNMARIVLTPTTLDLLIRRKIQNIPKLCLITCSSLLQGRYRVLHLKFPTFIKSFHINSSKYEKFGVVFCFLIKIVFMLLHKNKNLTLFCYLHYFFRSLDL